MGALDGLLLHLVESGGSDLLLAAESPPLYRIFGELFPVDIPPLTGDDVEAYLGEVLTPAERARLSSELSIDFIHTVDDAAGALRFRGNAYFQTRGLSAAFRAIPREVPTLEQLGLPAGLGTLVAHHQGLVLVTGPSGCGKTTTLAAVTRIINETSPLHIITIEDPVEFRHRDRKALVVQRQVGTHVISFPHALRAALREDPDVILVGELRDLETIQLAITASETGHLVLGTLNTAGAAQTIDRIIDSFPGEKQPQIRLMLSDSLRGIVSQQLLRRADGRGLVPAVEVLMVTPSVANLIREGKTFQLVSALQTGRAQGMQMMDAHLQELVAQGFVALEEAMDHVHDRKAFVESLERAGVKV